MRCHSALHRYEIVGIMDPWRQPGVVNLRALLCPTVMKGREQKGEGKRRRRNRNAVLIERRRSYSEGLTAIILINRMEARIGSMSRNTWL